MIDYKVFIIVWYTLQRIFVSSLRRYVSKVSKGAEEGAGGEGILVPFRECVFLYFARWLEGESAYVELEIFSSSVDCCCCCRRNMEVVCFLTFRRHSNQFYRL